MHRLLHAFIDGLAESSDEQSLHSVIQTTAAALDLNCFAYLALPARSEARPRLISNYPAQWTAHYLESHYERLDPVIAQALRDLEPFEWGPGIGITSLTREQMQLLENAAAFGIRCGFTIPIHDGRGPVAALTYASEERASAFQRCIRCNGLVLQLMALCFHAHVRRKLGGQRSVAGIVLSPREFECLQWAAQGKSAWDIGRIVGISRRTAAFHLDNARKKLGVRSTCQAVARFSAAISNTV